MNCELRKNLWLEFTPTRLLISPLIVSAIVAIVYLSKDSPERFFEVLLVTSGVLTGFILLLWAMKLAAESITSEVNDRTWVFQRMSSISAWEMTLGKLFGSTVYAWYSATFCFLAYTISALNLEDSWLRLKFGIFLILTAIVGHSLSILFNLNVVKTGRFTGKKGKNSGFIFGVAIGLYILFISASIFSKSEINANWFIWSINSVDFLLLSSIYATFWGVMGLYRMMRAELQYDNTPILWCCFVLSLLIYLNGLAFGGAKIQKMIEGNLSLWCSFSILVLMSYFTLMIESFEPITLRKVINRVHNNRWKEAAYYTPLWVPTIGGTIIIGMILFFNEIISSPSLFTPDQYHPFETYALTYLPLSALLLITRDLGLIGLIKSTGARKGDFYIAIYLGTLYGLMPTIVSLMGAKKILHFFWPLPMDGFLWQILPLTIEAVCVIWLVWQRREKIIGPKMNG